MNIIKVKSLPHTSLLLFKKKIIVDMLSPNIGVVKRAMETYPNSPSCLSQFSEVCPNSPGNEGFIFCFPQIISCH